MWKWHLSYASMADAKVCELGDDEANSALQPFLIPRSRPNWLT